jgi:uncharacterized protein (TIGR00255 family)
MTAFARLERSGPWGQLAWELRSVNHRYLEPVFRLPDPFRQLEPYCRERLKSTLKRGKVDCSLQFIADSSGQELGVDDALLERLCRLGDELAARHQATAPVSPLELLRWPGVLRETGVDQERLREEARAAFDEAVAQLDGFRAREGAELAAMIVDRVDAIERLTTDLRAALPELRAAQRQRLLDRLGELDVSADPQRLEQELVIMAQRADVDEELDRLGTHLGELRRVVAGTGPCGRRLDFLLQEINREANTLGSKSGALQTTNTAVEIKVLIEQIREQAQNLE